MGHKRVFNIITSQCINGQWGIADIAFSITSKEKALWQMELSTASLQEGNGSWEVSGTTKFRKMN